MPRPRLVVPSRPLEIHLPEDLRTTVDLHLWSELEGRVPMGKYKEFFCNLVRGFFGHRRLDLAPYANVEAGVFIVEGSPAAIEMLQRTLRGEHQ